MYAGPKADEIGLAADRLAVGRDSLRLEALGLMTAGIVHDLGNIVQVLSSALGMLNRHPDVQAAPALEPVVTSAVQSLEHAKALVGLISGFGRAGRAETEDVDIALCLAGLERLIRWITTETIRLDLRVSPACPRVTCSRRDLENALLNLVLNARDAMSGGGALTIEAEGCSKGGHVCGVVLHVTDTGEGMDAATLAQAFEPFFSTKVNGRGSGLGLAMVRRFAQEAGGGVTATSRPGFGTTVTLTLPAAAKPFG
jgi:signal transduction histidine kinase